MSDKGNAKQRTFHAECRTCKGHNISFRAWACLDNNGEIQLEDTELPPGDGYCIDCDDEQPYEFVTRENQA